MALERIALDGYGQVELNNCAFPRDGRIEAQCDLDATDFATAPCENGMLLAVDVANKVVKFADDASLPIALVYSSEHQYDVLKSGLKDFCLKRGDVRPRLGYLSVGDKFTTNCVSKDSATVIDGVVYGGIGANGTIVLSVAAPAAGPVLLIVDKSATMPDGQAAYKFQVKSV